MNIKPINNIYFNNYVNTPKNSSYNLSLKKLQTDEISFSGKKRPIQNTQELSESMKFGISIGNKLMKLQRSNIMTLENIETAINQISPVPIKIKDWSENPVKEKLKGNTVALMYPLYSAPDISLNNADIYIKEEAGSNSTSKEAGKLISCISHESTHIMQRYNDKSYFGLKDYTESIEEITFMSQHSQSLYFKIVKDIEEKILNDPKLYKKIRHNQEIYKEEIEKVTYGCIPSKKDLKEKIQFNIQKSSLNPKLKEKSLTDNFFDKMLNCIIKNADFEKEAYSVTIEMLEKWGKYNMEDKISAQIEKYINEIIIDKLQNS